MASSPSVRVRSSSDHRMLIIMMMMMMMMMLMVKQSRAQIAPALFVLGDSLADVGNNNYLPFSLVKANFPHNGVDFPNHKASGRFCNGRNAADFLADKLGLPSSPPYLSLSHNKNSNFLTGVSFASGGAGILDGTNQHSCLSMTKQIEDLAAVQEMIAEKVGQEGCDKIISKAVFAVVIGSNDILGYFGSSSSSQTKKLTPQQLVDSMLLTIKDQLRQIYDIGARKFALIGVGAVGCCPSQRDKNNTEACNDQANYWASKYNQGLISILQQYKASLSGFQYSYFDTYNVLLNFIQQPSTYGFKEVKAACCGIGELKAKGPCLPISSVCPNRSDHIFWDFYHPTQAAASIFIDTAFNGPPQYAFPINIRQLASL